MSNRHWMDEPPLIISSNGRGNEIDRVLSDFNSDNIDIEHVKAGEKYYFRTPLKNRDRYKILSAKLKNLRECLAWLAGFRMGFFWGSQKNNFKTPKKESRLVDIPLINPTLQYIFNGYDSHFFNCDRFDFQMGAHSDVISAPISYYFQDNWVIIDMTDEVPIVRYAAQGTMYWTFFNFLEECWKFKKLTTDEVAECVKSFFHPSVPFSVSRDVIAGERYLLNNIRGTMYTDEPAMYDQITDPLPKYLKGLKD